MKKIAKLMTVLATVAFTFTSCEDVPNPFGTVTPPVSEETVVVTPSGSGTADDPYNIAAAIEKCKEIGTTASTEKYYVKGIAISEGVADATYGNASFYMADSEDSSDKFYAFQVLGSDGQKMPAGFTVNIGDEVVVYGPIYNYQGNTPETASKGAAYIVTINGKKTSEGGSDDGGSSDTEAKAVTIAEFNAAAESNSVWYQLTGNVKNLKDGDQYGNFDLEDATGSVYVYGLLAQKGGESKKFQDLVAAKGIKEGSKLTIIGTRGSYNGKIEVMNAYFVSIENGGGSTDGSSLSTDFKANGQGDWTVAEVKALPAGLSYVWSYDSKYGMKASAYANGTRYETDSWLLSPALSLPGGGTMTFKQALNYATSDYVKVMYTTTNGTGNVNSSEWNEAAVDTWPAGNNWTFIDSKATLPAGTVRVAFRYTSNSETAATWEIESASIQ